MPATVLDSSGRTVAVQLDSAEAGLVVTIIRALQARSQRGWLPVPVEALLTACEQVEVAGQKMSATGQGEPVTRVTDEVLSTRQIAEEFGVDPRTARRWCRKVGYETAGRWFARRSVLEMR
jgi:hypothetical protein